MRAPTVTTNPFYSDYSSAPQQDIEAQKLRQQHVISTIPVYGRVMDYSVPPVAWRFRGGWVAPDVPTVAGPTYPSAVQAPAVQYRNHAYQGLVNAASNVQGNPNRPSRILTAPSIETTF